MWRILLILLLLPNDLSAQSLDGVYTGELVSSKNAFVVSTVETLAVGSVFLNGHDKLVFLGTFSNDSILEGRINLLNGDALILTGLLLKDSLLINLKSSIDTTLTVRTYLIKISSNTKYNLRKVFGRDQYSRDERLLGTWVIVGAQDQNRVKVPFENHTMEFKADGWLYINSMAINRQMSSYGLRNLEPKTKWETSGSKIISRFESVMFGSVEHILNYSIRGDTLTTQNSKGYEYVYKKK